MKLCRHCNQLKPLDQFYIYKKPTHRCKDCTKKAIKNNPKRKEWQSRWRSKTNHDINFKIQKWKGGAIHRGIEWSLTKEDILNIPLICFYSGISLTLKANQPNTVSLERIDSKKGYVKDNVVFCCADINRMKLDFDKDYFIEVCKRIATRF
jgi:hypothetical protein